MAAKRVAQNRKAVKQPASYEYTIRLSKLVREIPFKKRAPRAVREIKKLATKVMGTKDVRIDTHLNEMVWSKGIRYLPTRIRVQMCRKRNQNEDSSEQFYTLVKGVECANFKGLRHELLKDE